MARTNQTRRRALLDAAIDVLAAQGARGLTFRAVDTAAAVPPGTASNYFPDRDTLLAQTGAHVHIRLAPTPHRMAELTAPAPTRETVRTAMHDLFDRITRDPAGYIALLELRLEGIRRPHVRHALTAAISTNITDSIAFHVDGGYPGGRRTAVALYLAMSGLIVERLTLPDAWQETGFTRIIDDLVDTVTPTPDP
ncbi:TetR/AcrR family transcriptional regulator [Streptomonospora wellingtoniae]|uniref:TetR family transcriptional regulator n=1 Tax=Streptomonospora wellingtoniae TaxID=3075544 RepID=A0ABU2KXB7_9ACTN|nr:TetR family transcriptional regulator [Streptomonospora sp. DSM 45055]MDT0303733.1 TetR family transcriptional regulator [Streptomonospora sp. DSM 45055]